MQICVFHAFTFKTLSDASAWSCKGSSQYHDVLILLIIFTFPGGAYSDLYTGTQMFKENSSFFKPMCFSD